MSAHEKAEAKDTRNEVDMADTRDAERKKDSRAETWDVLVNQCVAIRGRDVKKVLNNREKRGNGNKLADTYVLILEKWESKPTALDEILTAGNVSAAVSSSFRHGLANLRAADANKDTKVFFAASQKENEAFASVILKEASKEDLAFLVFALRYLDVPCVEFSLVKGNPPNKSTIEAVLDRELTSGQHRDELLGLILVALDDYNGLKSSQILCELCANTGDPRTLPTLFSAYTAHVFNDDALVAAVQKLDPGQHWLSKYVEYVQRHYPDYHMAVRSVQQLNDDVSRRPPPAN